METMARGEDNRPRVHFLHVLSPVDAGVAPPEVACRETDTDVALSINTAKGKTVNLTLRKLGQPAGGHIRIEGAGRAEDRELTTTVDLRGAQPGL
jgi:hypothetical protein